MRRFLAIFCLAFISCAAYALEDWQDPTVFERNRLPMRATFTTDQQQTLSLNGDWKFRWSETPDQRLSDFFAAEYAQEESWDVIPVPGLWELCGYGDPLYLNIGYAWRGHYENNPPIPPTKDNHVGQYRRHFNIDKEWKGKQICLCIGSATSNVRVWVNGHEVGYSQDSKLEARFDITKYVKYGDNVIALEIFRWCDGTYLEDQDFWRFSGIARGVYVYTREQKRIEDVHVLADMNGHVKVSTAFSKGVKRVSYEILDPDGVSVASFSGFEASADVASPRLWSAETPVLYTLKVSAYDKKALCESTSIQFGFRSVEIRNSQLLVNGKPVLIKGADRHEMQPWKGYIVSEEDMIKDIALMKSLNMNAVRTCHYPDAPRWYSLCDRYGIYVVDEGNIESHGMGYKEKTLAVRPDYLEAHLSRDVRMVQRDFNHPSVIIWSLGNEAGNGSNFEACYKRLKALDPSRPVQYERAERGWNTDIFCPMYMSPSSCERYLQNNPDKPLIQCEYAHAMGNSIGNFKEYWDLVRKYPEYQGGFIWDFVDQGLWRDVSDVPGTDHVISYGGDYNDYDPSDGSFNCNGVVAADRSLHPHAYEVRYQYQNIHTSAAGAPGAVKVYNENFFKDLSDCVMSWNIEADGRPVLRGVVSDLKVEPQQEAAVDLGIAASELDAYAGKDLTLNVEYTLKRPDGLLPAGSRVAYDQIVLRDVVPAVERNASWGELSVVKEDGDLVFSGGCYRASAGQQIGWSARFDGTTAALVSYKVEGQELLCEPMIPNFDRAVTENDMGAALHKKQAYWRHPLLEVDSMEISDGDGCKWLDVKYKPIAGKAVVSLRYRMLPGGDIEVEEQLGGNLEGVPNLFRFGMRFAMPGSYSKISFYGLGPWENYEDRCSAAVLGRYEQSVSDQYHYGYVRTQESGTHSGLEEFCVYEEGRYGLRITADGKFSASALPFSIEDLDSVYKYGSDERHPITKQHGAPTHSLELKAKAYEGNRSAGTTYVCFEQRQMGVGGVHSWGTLPLEQYRIKAQPMSFRFRVSPVIF